MGRSDIHTPSYTSFKNFNVGKRIQIPACIIKHFIAVISSVTWKANVFVTLCYFHPSVMFLGKVGSALICFTRVDYGDSDIHSLFLPLGIKLIRTN